jgi:hypothetical protein
LKTHITSRSNKDDELLLTGVKLQIRRMPEPGGIGGDVPLWRRQKRTDGDFGSRTSVTEATATATGTGDTPSRRDVADVSTAGSME